MRFVLVLIAACLVITAPASAKKKDVGRNGVEANWDPRIDPNDPRNMSLEEFLISGYGPLPIRRPGVNNGGRDEDYINGNQVR